VAILVLELNDAGLTWTDGAHLLATEPGYAVLAPAVLTGIPALAQAHLEPHLCRNRYWDELSAEPGADDKSHAEIAFLQLQRMFKDLGKPNADVLLVTPSHYSREQLGLVLGITQECGIKVTGLVESAVAASSRPSLDRQLMHLDMGLHRLSVAVIGQDEAAQVDRAEHLIDTGVITMMDRWAHRISELFVIATRFDPLHHAETEQRLYDALPDWVAQLRPDEKLEVDLDGHSLHLESNHFVSALEDQFRALAQLIGSLRIPGVAVALQLSDRLAKIPGLRDYLGKLDDCEIITLPASHTAVAVGAAMEHLSTQAQGGLRLIRRLPWREEPSAGQAPVTNTAAAAAPEPLATHVVYQGIARTVSSTMVIGRSPAADGLRLVLVGDTEAISAEHCEVQRRDGELWLRDLSRYGTLVNQQRVAGEARLRPGDQIQIGGQMLAVIAMAENDGT
jgi:hypothetical protein